eukprot:CAMPEP_0118697196 /NCGR_PEP_ID=MMETSP0800-20121206/14340_1 /TAXON_ID=210618 ORGANISM="Striatella unipunctata, Strain CCMP2910" /NCGR_SAMPLE_ID=MMETSP0800 /ASSEMBLY_ACC=CAM_ASM_000638 /LENGTH=113 /DNA_ID=CAMNT_0006596537 /DNA_START=41 /DNA_END=382 /DNA_ORIENTATION=-
MSANNMILAQLMKDMQDPEMMREAQEMMNSPAFQAQMRQMTENPAFQKAIDKTKEMMSDPEKAKKMEEAMKTRITAGNNEIEQLRKERKEALGEAGATEDDMPDMGDSKPKGK